jgi:mono/diheme cytochrome c family protein
VRLLFCGLASIALSLAPGQTLTPEQTLGKDVFQACRHCHNILTDARKTGPSLRTLFGKVRLAANGKRTLEQNVAEFIREGKDGMPSYKYMFRPAEFDALMSYLKTLRSRPEIRPVLKPIRGSDEEILASGKRLHAEHCGPCHDAAGAAAPALLGIYRREKLANGEPVAEAAIVPMIREGHGGMAPKRDVLDDWALFRLIAFLKAE